MNLTVLDNSSPVLGTFGKGCRDDCGVPMHITVNFGLSAGRHCNTECIHQPMNGGDCYGWRVENLRPDRKNLAPKLARHENSDPADVMHLALLELQARVLKDPKLVWCRFSTNGSLPFKPGRRFARYFREFLRVCEDHEVDVHIPVESPAKARTYRSISSDLCVIRESCQSKRRFMQTKEPSAFVVGELGTPIKERLAACRKVAVEKQAQGCSKVALCPAVVNALLKKQCSTAKCGYCTMCSDPDYDIIFPKHP